MPIVKRLFGKEWTATWQKRPEQGPSANRSQRVGRMKWWCVKEGGREDGEGGGSIEREEYEQ